MKTNKNIRHIIALILLVFILGATESYSQQMIKLTDGTELKVIIVYQNNDTVKYYIQSSPEIVYVETMQHIAEISQINSEKKYKSDSLKKVPFGGQYLHYKHLTNAGIILSAGGVVTTIVGIAGLSSGQQKEEYDFTADAVRGVSIAFLAVGGALVLSGTILAIVGAKNMKKIEKKLNGLSFKFQDTPQIKGISVVYRF